MPNSQQSFQSDVIDRRDYGKMEAQVERLTRDVHELTQTVEEIRDMMQQANGGWRAVVLLGGIASAIGAAISWALSHIKVSP